MSVTGCIDRVAGREQQVCPTATWLDGATSMPYSEVSGLQVTTELQVAFQQVCPCVFSITGQKCQPERALGGCR